MIDRSLKNQKRSDSESGSVLVEFALASLLAFTLTFMIIDIGRAVFVYNVIANDARLASRYAMVRGSACGSTDCPATPQTIKQYIASKSAGINTNLLQVGTTWGPSTCGSSYHNDPGCVVTINISYPFNVVSPQIAPISMSSSSSMTISQ